MGFNLLMPLNVSIYSFETYFKVITYNDYHSAHTFDSFECSVYFTVNNECLLFIDTLVI